MWNLLILWMLPCHRAVADGIYECGAHGRFEYCIDGIPGCVVGCHCHPGYYFDTETKICEPNTKLTLNYRRQSYMPEPTRVQNPTFLSNVAQTESLPTLTTRNIIDEHVNDITKNADDLGDWLYNQFFKTIENQVINNTNKDPLTRRSGRGSLAKHSKLKRRARRKGSKHKKNKKGLQGKLLRIAEDDSLFQSSDSSDSDSSRSDFIQSDSSFESDSDEDHGHKKILLINKKPRPPLPSFIFLPNINTPYYPPIGLPPPPVMPMYPMVPVPPMLPAPPLLSFPGHVPDCEEHTTTTTAGTTTSTTPTTTVTISTKEVATETDSVTTAQTNAPSTDAPAQRSQYRGRKRKRIKSLENIPDEDDELPLDFYEPTRDSRQKLIKLMRQRMKYPKTGETSLQRYKKPFDKYMNQLIAPDTLMVNDFPDDVILKNEKPSPTNIENTSDLENVDFKYLSQLIHRVNENQTKDLPVHDYNLQDSLNTITPSSWFNKRHRDHNVPLDSGRRVNPLFNKSRNHQGDDSYYSSLGRQIATLIRTIDADKERQFNIEIETVQPKTYAHPYFNENGPRTFWERSVRSPLRFFNSLKTKFDNVKTHSNELLFNIENKIETIASTPPTLSLQELENLINVMETARTQFKTNTNIKNTKPFSKTLNVNLWPQERKQSKKSIKTPTNPNVFEIQRRKANNYPNRAPSEILDKKTINLHPFTNQDHINKHNPNNAFINHRIQIQPTSRNITKMYSQPKNKVIDVRAPHSSENSRLINKPTILNYKNIKKYFFDTNNQYSFQNDDLRLRYSPGSGAVKQQINPLAPSPYFHHEINHVDYVS